ncbi:MAG TPA: PASTA domain-containing protein, partial [Candidatus Hydrogenedens sp.]|nr:PASTA domain-containing protein [Candidatus Hydrogenedens sp.]
MKNKIFKCGMGLHYIFFCVMLLVFSSPLTYAAPIPISTLNGLKNIGVSTPLNADYILTADIDASETRFWPGGFDPIGDDTHHFTGSFNGNGHIIYDLYIARPTEKYVGLFSYIEGGSIKDLKLYNVDISGMTIVGGVAGTIEGTDIKGCIVHGQIQASSVCGGIVGSITSSSSDMSISMCYTLGSLSCQDFASTAKEYFGGLVGVVEPHTNSITISNSFSHMNIFTSISDMSFVGGFVGELTDEVYVVECYSVGEVPNGNQGIGGLIGYADHPEYVENSVWDMETSRQTESSGGKGYSTNEMIVPDTYSDLGWDISSEPCVSCSTTWSIYKDYTYPFLCDLSNIIPNVEGDELATAIDTITKSGFNSESVQVYHNTIPSGYVIETIPEKSCYFPYGYTVTVNYSIGPYPPIYISTIEQLQLIGNDPNYPNDNIYILSNDIDASATRDWNSGKGFIPIETFSGVLDGDGHKISGLYISDDSGEPTGLFRTIKKPNGSFGKVQNLIVENVEIYGIGYVGVIAGKIETSVAEIEPTLTNIATSGEVFGINSVGGLAGAIYGGITANDCSIRANVNARVSPPKITYGHFGGVCGRAIGCNLSRISFIGAIRSGIGNNFGGIAGSSSMDSAIGSSPIIKDCYAHVSIQNTNPSSDNIGGLIGFADVNTEIDNCYSASTFSNSASAGGLIGDGTDPITVSNCFWDKEISGVSTSFGGGTAETTENMKKTVTYPSSWDFANVWGIIEDKSYPLLYNDLIIMINLQNWYYVNAMDWLSFYGISSDINTRCSNVIPQNNVISQSVSPQEWIQVFPTDQVILDVSDGLCPPITVNSINQIAQIGKVPEYPLDGYYVLENNIDASDTVNWNSGAGFEPIKNFTGLFSGAGHIISDLYINRPTEDYVGFFGFLENSARIINVYILKANVTGRGAVGILAGNNLGQIYNCGVHGTVQGNDSFTGGLVGDNSGIIYESLGVAQVIGTDNVGGLIGTISASLFMGTNHENYFWGTVSGNNNVGGFIGYNRGYIENCYTASQVTANKGIIGGFCATNDTSATIDSSYWDKEYSGIEISEGGEGKTTMEMMTQTTFSGWDFSSIWMINESVTYPFIQNNYHSNIGDLRGINYNTLKNYFTSLGYFPSSTERCDWTYGAGLIVEHTFMNLDLPIFSNIDFVVSSGFCTTVPDVVGDTLINAINEINSAHLVVGSVVEECNTYPLGVVFEQYPVNGEVVVEGTTVSLKVSSGPCPEGEGTPEGVVEGTPEGVVEGTPEGVVEGTPEGVVEGTPEGVVEGTPEGVVEGTPEGVVEG